MNEALWELIEESNRLFGDQSCVSCQGREYSFGDVRALSLCFAAALRKNGIGRGDRVVTVMRNSPEYIIAFFGMMRIGAVCVPLSPLLVKDEIRDIISRCSPALAVVDDAGGASLPFDMPALNFKADVPDAGREVDATPGSGDELAMIIYTSGTTAAPKGVMLTHNNLVSNARAIVEYLKLTPRDSVMAVMPFSFSYGHSLITTHVLAGGRIVIENSFVYPVYVMKRMEEEQVTGFSGVPAHYMLLRKSLGAFALRSLRYFTQSAGFLPWHVVDEFVAAFPHVKFYYMYGQTEASPRLSYLEPELVSVKKGSIGRGIGGVSLSVVDDALQPVKPGQIGQITAIGPNVMRGYYNDPEGTAKVIRNGRLFTGDLGTVDEDGYIYIIAREKAIIKSGAYRISPAEIEETVTRIPGVLECVVTGVPDDILGEAVKLSVRRENADVSQERILEHCRNHLAGYKVPKSVEFVESFARTASGKIRMSGPSPKARADI